MMKMKVYRYNDLKLNFLLILRRKINFNFPCKLVIRFHMQQVYDCTIQYLINLFIAEKKELIEPA